MADCEHDIEKMEVMGQQECAECVLVRLSPPLRQLYRFLKMFDQDESLHKVKARFYLTKRDILLMGWVWDEWCKRTDR